MSIPKLIALLLLPAYILAIAIFASIGFTGVFESTILLPIFNTLFIGLIPIAFAGLAARVFLVSGSRSFLLMGCGILTFGLSSISAGLSVTLPEGPNLVVTIHNSGVLVAAIFQVISGMLLLFDRNSPAIGKRNRPVMLAYGGIVILTLLFSLATVSGLVPRFFIQGTGPTPLRQFVLISAMNIYLLSAALFMIHYRKWRSDFLYWYALSLALIGVGLFAILLQKTVGGPICWLGRSAQYIGGLFGLVAILKAASSAIAKQLPIEESMASLFSDAETSYRNLVEIANDGIITLDQTGRIVGWNPAAERIFDRSKSEAIGSIFFDLFNPNKYANVLKTQIEALRKPSPRLAQLETIEIEASRKDGAQFPVELSMSVRETGIGWLCTCIVRDITDRKRSEAALRENERFLSNVFGSIQDGISILDKDMNIMMVNQTMERWYAHALPFTGKKCFEVYHGASQPCQVCPTIQTLKTGKSAIEVVPMTGPGGERIGWGELYSFPLSDLETGELKGVIEYVRDITQRKYAEEDLRESEERYRTLVELSPGGVCINVEGRYVFANSAMARIVGLADASEVIGKEALDFVHPDSHALVKERIRRSLQDSEPAPLTEEKYIRTDGTTIYMEVAAIPIIYQGQKASQVMIRDITDRKKSDAILQEKTEALEKAYEELERFAYVASHDLREPLRKMSSFSQLLGGRYKGQLDEKADKYIWYIVDGAKRMEKLIEDLLGYSRLGRADLTLATTSAENSVKQATTDLEQVLLENDAEITYNDLPIIQANPGQLEQLFRNLIHNAVKFRSEDKPRVHISARKKNGSWVFSVKDNGIGIDPEQWERIFRIFQRLHTRDEYSGTGIGLAIAKKIVERHGGRIWVESEPGKGSTFYFTVPER